MSNANEPEEGIETGDPLDFDQLSAECDVLSEYAVQMIMEALGRDRVPWMHVAGVALTLLRRNLIVPGVPKPNQAWLHEQILQVHDLTHIYQEGGGEAVIAALNESADEVREVHKHHLH